MANKPAKQKKTKKVRATILSAKSLGLARNSLPHSIVEVVSTLQRAGFDAYIVGGGVRDSLLGLAPKDFDAVTNARPHEIKAIFGGRCRIIGKRFQLAHVHSGRELIEVATFRAPPKDDLHTTEDGMITRDNVWGDINQDFARRDFSINALYYDPIKGEVLDFCGAVQDIKDKTLRLLGDAKVRIEEDPVRLLRALRFKAKLGFDFDKTLAKQFSAKNWALLEQVSTHRLYDETQKMFSGGYLAPLLPLLFEYGASSRLFAMTHTAPSGFITQVAKNTDERIAQNLGANPAFFYAGLLWESYLLALEGFKNKGLPFYEAQNKACAKVLAAQNLKTAIPRFAEDFISDIWVLQSKFVNPRLKDIDVLARHMRFRAVVDFLVQREILDDSQFSEPTQGMGAWWQEYQYADEATRQAMTAALAEGKTLPKRRQRQKVQTPPQIPPQTNVLTAPATPKPNVARAVYVPQVPVFEKIAYQEADFLRLLAMDDPYIPSQRFRRRTPSSTLSIIEREKITKAELAHADHAPSPKKPPTTKKSSNKRSKRSGADETAVKTPTPKTVQTSDGKPKKRRKKSNAKPRAQD